jgi:hypothetical protein
MSQFYTLEEAARVLGMSPEELKSKAQAREVRAFLDGGSWRFHFVDVDELARGRGVGTHAELRLSDLEVPAASGLEDGENSDLSEFQLGVAKPDPGKLAPLSEDALPTMAAKPGALKTTLASTPPPAVRRGEKDIYDDTDFEVDVPLSDDDSDDKTMQLEATSDFELEESDSASEVFAIDEEAVDQNAATAMAPAAFAEDDDEDEDRFESAVSSERAGAVIARLVGDRDDLATARAERSGPAVVISRESKAEWGGLWVGVLGVASLLMLLSLFIAVDLVRNFDDFRSDGPASGLVRAFAGLFGGG